MHLKVERERERERGALPAPQSASSPKNLSDLLRFSGFFRINFVPF
jgi:hypothetical protein